MTEQFAETKRQHGKKLASMTRVESNMITRLITTNSRTREEDKKVVYTDGWDDNRVAAVVSEATQAKPPITADQVARERRRTFPDWLPDAKKSKGGAGGYWVNLVRDLEARVNALESLLTGPQSDQHIRRD